MKSARTKLGISNKDCYIQQKRVIKCTFAIQLFIIFRIEHHVAQRLVRHPVNTATGHNAARRALDRAPLALLVAHPERLLPAVPAHGLALLELPREVEQLARQVDVAPAHAQRLHLHVGEGVARFLGLRRGPGDMDGGVIALDNVR